MEVSNGNNKEQNDSVEEVTRIDSQYIFDEIGSVLSLKKGIFLSIKEVLLRPGENIRIFLLEDRTRLVKPIIFLIFCSLFYSILQQTLHFEDAYYDEVYKQAGSDAPEVAFSQWVRANYGYANIVTSIFIAFILKMFFRKHGYNYFELLILLLYITGIGMLMYGVLGTIESFSGIPLYFPGGIIVFFYTVWAMGQFFGKRKFINYVKAFFSYALGWVLIMLLAGILGILISLLST